MHTHTHKRRPLTRHHIQSLNRILPIYLHCFFCCGFCTWMLLLVMCRPTEKIHGNSVEIPPYSSSICAVSVESLLSGWLFGLISSFILDLFFFRNLFFVSNIFRNFFFSSNSKIPFVTRLHNENRSVWLSERTITEGHHKRHTAPQLGECCFQCVASFA